MSITLGPTYHADFTGTPPRMAPRDLIAWQNWWPTTRATALRVWFDVGLDSGRPVPPNTPPELAAMWARNTQHRADAIIERPATIDLVELRDTGNASAVGQLQLYGLLWQADPPNPKLLRLLLVVNRADPSVVALATHLNIRVIDVGAQTKGQLPPA